MKDKKQADLRLMPEKQFGELVTAITRVPKPKSDLPKAKAKRIKSRARKGLRRKN